jgi:hypothetical protein
MNMNMKNATMASLNQCSFLLSALIESKFIYHGEEMANDSPATNKIWRKIYGENDAKITVGVYRYFIDVNYYKEHGWMEWMEKEFDKLN